MPIRRFRPAAMTRGTMLK